MFGDLISAGAKLIGGIMGQDAAEDAQADANYRNAQNIELQRQFAQQGIQWKVADAKAAGIHPLYALGASTHSFSPQTISGGTASPLADAISSMGADVGRAAQAGMTGGQRADDFTRRLQSLQLTRGELENEKLASEIAQLKGINPAFPSGGSSDDPRTVAGRAVPLKGLPHVYDESSIAAGKDFAKNPWWSDAQKVEDRYGDIVENIGGVANLIADWYYSNPSAGPWLRALTRTKGGLSTQERRR